ncbi:MAG TPA: DUF86 domain-containing protein [Spirochaetota bacterium]|nr:DUF86 domain-containing protein [Spirochaetota bacterium]HNT12126.1 DUF86 domain-containing protein [Spirochaetota bacterium]
MYDREIVLDLLQEAQTALSRIPVRMREIDAPEAFKKTEAGIEKFDAICMVLLLVGEIVKSIDKKTEGALFSRYPGTNWKGVKGVRDVIAHGYLDLDEVEIYNICIIEVPALIEQLDVIIKDLQ